MRTTLTIDDDLAAILQRESRQKGLSFKELVNAALLLGRPGALRASRAVSWMLLLAGLFVSWNWLAWWAVTRFGVRLGHPPALDERPLDRARIAVAVFSRLLFAVTFITIPIAM